MQSTVITVMVRRRKMSRQCKKCLRGAMTVHIAANGLCEECETERVWSIVEYKNKALATRSNTYLISSNPPINPPVRTVTSD